ncbi:DcuS/MalK family sensor histidine kinase [Alkalicoccus daliensis]|uniref:histidine kinase n=1 Tax=Alkalicoccus daliensis TaxID=745820 RepID=A0A1H0HF57_9BACI|nr:two-component system, CitB family, sensor histidine kinase MalK [Alkalicoccus daliensis]
MKRKFGLSTIITLFVCIVVLVSLLVTDILISTSTSERIQESEEEKALLVSRTVAESSIVAESLAAGEPTEEIQAYTNEVQSITELLFVVVMDMEAIRYTHPTPERIGLPFAGGDEEEVLEGEEYVSISEGTLGESLRAFTPIYDDFGNQLGAVVVGISLENVDLALQENHWNIVNGSLVGIIVGILGALLLAGYIKRILFGLEPYEISKLLEERSAMLQSVHEGIVAVDEQQKITLVNQSALQLFRQAGLPEQPIGMKITDFMPNTKLDRVMETEDAERDEEQTLNGIAILTNREPIIVNGEVVGAIATFRDKTEVNQLAQQLTGVKTYIEALRAQTHEFMNRLHVILGMVQMEAYDELIEFIRKIIDLKKQDADIVTKRVKDPVLAGFFMGKMSYARERNVTFIISPETKISRELDVGISKELITIIGNLVDNAIESLANTLEKEISLEIIEKEDKLQITVADNGPGISRENVKQIFEKGFSTKGTNRGFGLYLMKQSMEKLNGTFEVDSNEEGTIFKVEVEHITKGKEEEDDD